MDIEETLRALQELDSYELQIIARDCHSEWQSNQILAEAAFQILIERYCQYAIVQLRHGEDSYLKFIS